MAIFLVRTEDDRRLLVARLRDTGQLANPIFHFFAGFEGDDFLRLDVHPFATYANDFPRSRDLGGGWRVDCVPSPYLYQPRSTVGLGDTFVAGTLLAHGLMVVEASR